MKLSTLLTAALMGSGVMAVSNEHMETEINKRAGFIVTSGATGATAPRLEIRTMAKNAPLWNLYLLAMQKFQAMPQSDPMSYYQIAGVYLHLCQITWRTSSDLKSAQVSMDVHSRSGTTLQACAARAVTARMLLTCSCPGTDPTLRYTRYAER
jgi:hypothetical protein